MEMYSIGEIAEKLGVTPGFLKYYEQHGLISPKIGPNGYRSYSIDDANLVCECVRLKNMGFSARQVQELLTSADYTQMLEMMNDRQHEMEKQIRYMEYIHHYFKRLNDELPSYDQASNWSIGQHNNFYYFPQSVGSRYLDDPRANRLSREWMSWMPVTLSTAKADYRLGKDQEVEWGLSINRPFADEQEISVSAPAYYVPACRCLEYWDKREMKDMELSADELFVHMRDVVEKYHLVITGPSYFFVRSKLHENGHFYTYQKILTPIE